MRDKEITKKANLDCALEKEPVKNLKDILKLYNKDWLSDYYYAITKSELGESKQSMINKIYDELIDENVINRFLNTLIEDEYEELVRIIRNNGELLDDYIEHISYLKTYGVVYTFNYNNKLHVIIPEEIMVIIEKLDISKYYEKAIENSKLVNLAYSMLNLYGVVPLNFFLEACCKYYNYHNSKEIDLECIFMPERMNSIRSIRTDNNVYMVKAEFLDECYEALVGKIISKSEDELFRIDFKEIALEDLLKYNDLFYYEETDAVLEFKEYLRDNDLTDENIDLLIGAMVSTFKIDYSDGGIIFKRNM